MNTLTDIIINRFDDLSFTRPAFPSLCHATLNPPPLPFRLFWIVQTLKIDNPTRKRHRIICCTPTDAINFITGT